MCRRRPFASGVGRRQDGPGLFRRGGGQSHSRRRRVHARLFNEVREKRGLAYSVYTQLHEFDHCPTLIGGAATKNDRAKETLDVIEEQCGCLRARADRGRAGQGQEISDRQLCAALRHLD